MNKLLIFLLGAGAGSAITWYITKETYRRIADEEIASVIDKFKEREDELKGIPDENPNPNYRESNEDISQPDKVVDINSFKQIVENEDYEADMSEDESNYTLNSDVPERPGPYEISEEEYNQYNDYGYPFEWLFRFPTMNFGSYDCRKNVNSVIVTLGDYELENTEAV